MDAANDLTASTDPDDPTASTDPEKYRKAKRKAKVYHRVVPVTSQDKQIIISNLRKVVQAGLNQRDRNLSPKKSKDVIIGSAQAQDMNSSKKDDLLEQFYQYVVYGEMEKRKQRALEFQTLHASNVTHKQTVPTTETILLEGNNKQAIEQKEEPPQSIVQFDAENVEDNQIAFAHHGCLNSDQNILENQLVVQPEKELMEAAMHLTEFLAQEEQGKVAEEEQHDHDASSGGGNEYGDSETEEDVRDTENSTKPFLPTGELIEEKKPEIGMHFDTLEAVQRFCNFFGYIHGFGVVKGRNYKDKKITLQCNKARKTHAPENAQRKRKRSVMQRTSCPMNVTVKLTNGQWEIIGVNLEHNHDLSNTPSLTKFLSNLRSMSEEDKNLAMILQDCRVPPRRIMSIFRRLKGNRKIIPFNKNSIKNLCRLEKREKNTDIAYALKFVEKLQARNKGIVYKLETDADNTVRSILWTDSRSQMDYELYGEFISFDTTFSTNKYNMPFAPFVGINGQGRTIVFAWALLKDQTAEMFKWAFETFLDVMKGKRPEIIMTDQDVAMKSAIDEVLSSRWHRFCFWHILNNCHDKMGGFLAAREGMEEEMMRVIMDSLTIDESESKWVAMIEKYDASSSKHLPLMWKWRKQWVPVYFKEVFCPFIRTTGRSEGMNSIFKDYVKRKDTLETFLVQYDLFQESIIEIENEDRFQSNEQAPIYWGHNRIERHAGKLYTRGIFFKFQNELLNSTAFAVEVVEEGKTYNLRKTFNYSKQEFHQEVFQVQVDRTTEQFDCICCKFKRDGILCCHVLRLFTQFDIIHKPERYIKKRWTKEYREAELLKYKKKMIESDPESNSSQISVRYAIVMSKVTEVCAEVTKHSESSKAFLEDIQKLENKYRAKHNTQPQHGEQQVEEPLKDPPIRMAKSVDKGQRLKRQSEKNVSKKNAKKKNEKQQKATS